MVLNKSNSESTTVTSATEEFKDSTVKYNLNKFDYDLYHEECDIALPIIRVKRLSLPNNGEKWKIFNDTKLIFTIEGSKISKKERLFLETIEGFNFILAKAKSGIKSLNNFRSELKNILNEESLPPEKINKKKNKKSIKK